jgi:DNA polymerase-3 subunit gamma/tau
MSYLVLARKWRPQSFDDLVGQEHVSRTLGNAINQGRVAHAFLFTGVRGVGKTTSARILAKALNCVHGPTPKPDLTCSQCVEIAAGVDVDVQEIDAASNTGVDDVRRIQESLPYRPARDRFKILIVDEVHMLSGNAWNAFLKTLEEPPPHVKFIFATTEVNKVPITILSRCQRYDFKLISAQQIAARVRYILGEERITADDAAVQLVAREAAGSMRDALSILDQVIAFGGTTLKGDEVARVLGVADRASLHALASAVVEGRASDALKEIDRLASGGFDLVHVARDLLRRLRDLVVARVVNEPEPLLDLADVELADVKSLAATADPDDLSRLFQGFSRAMEEIGKAGTPRHALEVTVVRLARRPPLVPVDALLDRLSALEKRVGGGGGDGGGGGARPNTAPAKAASPAAPPMRAEPAVAPAPARASAPAPAHAPAPAPTASAVASASASVAVAPASTPALDVQPGVVVSTSDPLVQPDALLDDACVQHLRAMIAKLRAVRPTWGSLLEHGVVLRCDARGLEVAYERRSFLAAQVADKAVAEAFAAAAREELGGPTRIFVADVAPKGVTLATLSTQQKSAALDARRRAAIDHPSVKDAVEIFRAEVQKVKLPGEE